VSLQVGQAIYVARSVLLGKWFALYEGPLPSKRSLTHRYYFDRAVLANASSRTGGLIISIGLKVSTKRWLHPLIAHREDARLGGIPAHPQRTQL
jgi:hypothetical protein